MTDLCTARVSLVCSIQDDIMSERKTQKFRVERNAAHGMTGQNI